MYVVRVISCAWFSSNKINQRERARPLVLFHQIFCLYSNYSLKFGTLVWNILKIWTILLPITTNIKKAIRPLLMGGSSVCSAAFPMGTCPRLLMLPSNFFCLFRMFRGAGCCFESALVFACFFFFFCSNFPIVWNEETKECNEERMRNKWGKHGT